MWEVAHNWKEANLNGTMQDFNNFWDSILAGQGEIAGSVCSSVRDFLMLIFCQAYKDHAKQLVCDWVNLCYYNTDDSYRTVQNQHCNLSLAQDRTHAMEEMVLWTVVGCSNRQQNGSGGDGDFGKAEIFVGAIGWNQGVGEKHRWHCSHITSNNISFFPPK